MSDLSKQIEIINRLLDRKENRECADCNNKTPRWASTTFGTFICIKCAGFHRQLGTHITKVRSTNLDKWTPQMLDLYKHMNNELVNDFYEYKLPKSYPKPNENSTQQQMWEFIRNKYEKKLWVPKNADDPATEYFLHMNKKEEKKNSGTSSQPQRKMKEYEPNLPQPKQKQKKPPIPKEPASSNTGYVQENFFDFKKMKEKQAPSNQTKKIPTVAFPSELLDLGGSASNTNNIPENDIANKNANLLFNNTQSKPSAPLNSEVFDILAPNQTTQSTNQANSNWANFGNKQQASASQSTSQKIMQLYQTTQSSSQVQPNKYAAFDQIQPQPYNFHSNSGIYQQPFGYQSQTKQFYSNRGLNDQPKIEIQNSNVNSNVYNIYNNVNLNINNPSADPFNIKQSRSNPESRTRTPLEGTSKQQPSQQFLAPNAGVFEIKNQNPQSKPQNNGTYFDGLVDLNLVSKKETSAQKVQDQSKAFSNLMPDEWMLK